MMREDLAFDAGGSTLRGWLYRPEPSAEPAPIIVMAHGFSAVKEMYLDRFAEVFAGGGFAVLVFDHRNFGASEGEPRQEINPWQQIEDYRHAITFISLLPGVDANRVGVWGTSYSGGHVLVVGATDRRVRCVVAQVPTLSGHESGLRRVPAAQVPSLTAAFAADRVQRMLGEPPVLRKVVGASNEYPVFSAADAVYWFLEGAKLAPAWKNEVTLRTLEWARAYEPGVHIAHISPTPLLMIVALNDTITDTDLQLEAFNRALEPKRLVTIPGGHFDPYVVRFAEASGAAVDWFAAHL
jgi:cephalosporin-C deacetylase-like acetyl esterase